jgi:hypothetical protein
MAQGAAKPLLEQVFVVCPGLRHLKQRLSARYLARSLGVSLTRYGAWTGLSPQADFVSNCRFESSDVSVKALVTHSWSLHLNQLENAETDLVFLKAASRSRALVTGAIGW